MDSWKSRIRKRSLSREKAREHTIFSRVQNSITLRES